MKLPISILLCLLWASGPARAQVQYGQVRLQNSGKQPVEGVQIIFADAVPTLSDGAGQFRLVFHGKQPGDLVFKEKIYKKGYEVVNEKELDAPNLKIANSEKLGTDIILAKEGELEAAKKSYYQISDKALAASHERQKKTLRDELQQAKLSQEAFAQQLTQLQEQYEQQKKHLDLLADKFARINFDDVSGFYQEALQLFKEGNIDGALAKLQSVNLIGRAEKVLQEEKRLEATRQEISALQSQNQQRKAQTIEAIRLQAELHMLHAEVKKAETLYDQLLRLDSTDLYLLEEAASFYYSNHLYAKTLRTYQKVVEHPYAQYWQRTNAYECMANAYQDTGNLPQALQTCQQNNQMSLAMHQEMMRRRALGYIHNIYTDLYLAESYRQLGAVHDLMNNMQQALTCFQQANKLLEMSNQEFPGDLLIKRSYMLSCVSLGNLYGRYDSTALSLALLEKNLNLAEELLQDDPESETARKDLGNSYLLLGDHYAAQDDFKTAQGFFDEGARFLETLYERHAQDIWLKESLAYTYMRLGDMYAELGEQSQALQFLEKHAQLGNQLCAEHPQNVRFKSDLASALDRMGDIYSNLGNHAQAQGFFEQAYQKRRELHHESPQDALFKTNLALSCAKLCQSLLWQGKPQQAMYFAEQSYQVRKGLYAQAPEIRFHKEDFSDAHYLLGEVHAALGNLPQALAQYQEYLCLQQELYAASPQSVRLKENLSIAYERLGSAYLLAKAPERALPLVEQAFTLQMELYKAAPTEPRMFQILESGYFALSDVLAQLRQYENAYQRTREMLALVGAQPPSPQQMAGLYGNAAWLALLAKHFEAAEQYALLGLEADASQWWIKTNLAAAYLYQGKYEQAKQNYLQLKGKTNASKTPFKTILLKDIADFESAGITHPDVKKIRALLK